MNPINITNRHKLYWYKHDPIADLSAIPYPVINVGKAIAQFISGRNVDKHIGLEVEEYFKTMVAELTQYHWGIKGAALTNIGILLESELSLNVVKILMDISREIAVILIWPYPIENSRRLLWDDSAKFSLDFPEQTIHRLEL